MKKYLVLIVGLFFVVNAFARIGETLDECKNRYGEYVRVENKPDTYGFRKQPFDVLAEFYQGKCIALTLRKIEKDETGLPVAFSKLEIETLLEVNGGGQAWLPKKQESVIAGIAVTINRTPTEWMSSDGKLTAGYLIRDRVLCITTVEAVERFAQIRREQEQKRLQDQEAQEKQGLQGF